MLGTGEMLRAQQPGNQVTSLIVHDTQDEKLLSILRETLLHENCLVTHLNFVSFVKSKGRFPSIMQILQHEHNKVEHIKLGSFEFSATNCEALVDTLTHANCNIASIGLTTCGGGISMAIKSLAEALLHPNVKVHTLSLRYTKMSMLDIETLVPVFQRENSTLHKLEILDSNALHGRGAELLIAALAHPNCNVTDLKLAGSLKDKSIVGIARALKQPHNQIRRLDLFANPFGDTGLKALATALAHVNNKVEELKFGENPHFTQEGAVAIGKALAHENNRVKKLEFTICKVGNAGARAIAESMKHENNKLEHLELFLCRVAESGIIALAGALHHENNKLRVLTIEQQSSTAKGIAAMAQALRNKNSVLETVGLWDIDEMYDAERDVKVFRNLLVLVSALNVSGVGVRSPVKRLPTELVRLVAEMMPVTARESDGLRRAWINNVDDGENDADEEENEVPDQALYLSLGIYYPRRFEDFADLYDDDDDDDYGLFGEDEGGY